MRRLLPVPGSPAKKTRRWPARWPTRSASRPSACTTRRGPTSASVTQLDEQSAWRERHPQALLEEAVHECEAGEAQDDADRPALAGGSQVENGREQRGEGKAEKPDPDVHPENPPADRGDSARRVWWWRCGGVATVRAHATAARGELAGEMDARQEQGGRGDRPWEQPGARVAAAAVPQGCGEEDHKAQVERGRAVELPALCRRFGCFRGRPERRPPAPPMSHDRSDEADRDDTEDDQHTRAEEPPGAVVVGGEKEPVFGQRTEHEAE